MENGGFPQSTNPLGSKSRREVSRIVMRIRPVFLAAFVLAFLTPCFAHHTAVVVNKDNVVENVT